MPWGSEWDGSQWWAAYWFANGEADPNAMRAAIAGTSSITATLTGESSGSGFISASVTGSSSVSANLTKRSSGTGRRLPIIKFPDQSPEHDDDDDIILATITGFVLAEEDTWERLLTV